MVENFDNCVHLSDYELIELIKSGKFEFLTVLMNRYVFVVNTLCDKYGLHSEKDDVLQEATFSLYSAIASYDSSKSSFSTFATLIIKRCVVSFLRKNSLKKNIPDELIQSIEDTQISDFSNPEVIFLEKESYKSLTDSIRLELSKLELDVLNSFLSGLSYEEIASKLSITVKAVDNALNRIRKKLK